MHVLHLIDSLGTGGAERMLVDLANATAADGQRVSVCITRSDQRLASELVPTIELLVLERTARFDVRASLRLAQFIRDNAVDVLHVHMRGSLAYAALLRLLRVVRVPIVFHDHFGNIEQDRSVPRWFPIARRQIAQYVGVSEQLADWARSAGVAQVSVIPNGLALERLTAPPTNLGLGLTALLVASFKREKGIDVAIAALADVPGVMLVVVGGGESSAYARECRAQAVAAGVSERVVFLGARTDVPALLAGADIALLASHSESGPLVLIEYLAAGLPIVWTLVGDIGRRLHAQCVPGHVAPGDRAAFARELRALVEASPETRTARGAEGRRALSANWDVRAALPRWYEVYRQAIRS